MTQLNDAHAHGCVACAIVMHADEDWQACFLLPPSCLGSSDTLPSCTNSKFIDLESVQNLRPCQGPCLASQHIVLVLLIQNLNLPLPKGLLRKSLALGRKVTGC